MRTFLKKKILIIDDDILFCNATEDYLAALPIEITSANSGSTGLRICSENRIDPVR